MGDILSIKRNRTPTMTEPRRRGLLHPIRAFKKSHRGEPNPLWLNTQTAPWQVSITLYYGLVQHNLRCFVSG